MRSKNKTYASKICPKKRCVVRIKEELEFCVYHSVRLCLVCSKPIKFKSKHTNSLRQKLHDGECLRIRENEKMNRFNRKRLNTGQTEDQLGGIYFGDAKEPLMPAPKDCFGFLGVIRYNKSKEKIQCHICGMFFRSLGTSAHLKVHKTTNEKYKKRFGIARTVALCAEKTREKHVAALVGRTDYDNLQKQLLKYAKSPAANIQRRNTHTGKKRRMSTRNKTGHCPLQLLEPIKKLEKKLGFVPNGEDFKREYKGKYRQTIVQMYGSYNEAVKIAGYEPRTEDHYTHEQLIEMMKNFYKEHKRTPSNSDFNRGYLPTYKVWEKYFGSLNRARAIADVPLMLRVGGGWAAWAEVPLTPELKEQMVNSI